MDDRTTGSSSSMRFLSFADDEQDAEKAAKLKEAALRIEQAIERQKSVSELIDYKPPPEEGEIDPANDTRSLYERLLEQKNKKQEAFEESHKLSNLVTKLDEDEANYLNELAKTTREEEIRKRLEVQDILEEKKRNSERNIDEAERRLKESFLGKTNQPTTKTKSNNLKSKLSSFIKVKPKPQASKLDTLSTMVAKDKKSTKDDSAGAESSSSNSTLKRQSDGLPHSEAREGAEVSNYDHSDPKRAKPSDSNQPDQISPGDIPHVDHERCNCVSRTDVMRCIGVLPSLPLLKDFPDSSDSDNSDDNLNPRIVPRIGGSRKHH